MRKQIIGTGLSGLVGSRVVELLSDGYDFENLSLETGVNILNKDDVVKRISRSSADWVLHFAAKTDVDGCETDKPLGKDGNAWKINVGGTENVIHACNKSGKKILHISTDFVFDGEKEAPYTEEDIPGPVSWYGMTKYEAEKVVQNAELPYLICRLSFPYRADYSLKNDLVHVIINKLKAKEKISGITDQTITPTFIDDIALAIKILIERNSTGIYHLTGSQPLSPYDLAFKIAKSFSLDSSLIKKTSGKIYFSGRAKRPFHSAVNNDKIKALGAVMHTFDEGLEIIKKQMNIN